MKRNKKRLPLLFGTLAAGVVCLTLGIGTVFGGDNDPPITPNNLVVVDKDDNNHTSAEFTYGQWSQLKAGGLEIVEGYDFNASNFTGDGAGIYQEIAGDAVFCNFEVRTVTVNCYVDNNQVSSSDLFVAYNATISIDANNVIKIGPTNLTAYTNEGYEFVGLFNSSDIQITASQTISVTTDTSVSVKWEKAGPPTILTINNTGGSARTATMNIFKEDNRPTKIIVGNSAPIISSTSGTQDIQVTLPTSEYTITISGGGKWYFDSNCLGNDTNNGYLTAITFGDNYGTRIGSYAFSNSALTSITLPSSVTSIKYDAFIGCSSLTSITIPSSVTSIEFSAFENSGLTSITIPSSVTSIGDYAFSGCSSLTSITVATGNTKYDSRNTCNAIIETATNTLIVGCKNTVIPNTVTSIEDNAFRFSGLTSITIPSSVTSIDRSAFSYCPSLTSITVASDNTKYDSRNSCKAIIEKSSNTLIVGCKNTVIPSTVTSIGSNAFTGCSSLTSITIPSSVTKINYDAFRGCSGLTSITIPSSVTSIGSSAFYGCSTLQKVTFASGSKLSSIESNVFYGCSGLTSITIPSSVTSIGSSAFENSGLTSITIPSSVTSIGGSAFKFSGLTSITIPSNVTSIKSYTFQGCSGLTSITIPSSVTSIESFAFAACSGLTSISVASGNTKYDSRNNCNAIIEKSSNALIVGCKNTVIPNTVTSIGNNAFSYCKGLTSITIPSSVTSIGSLAFRDCSGLTSITIPSSVTSINYDAFQGSGLTTISVATDNTVYDSRNNCNAIIKTATNTLIVGCKNTVIPSTVTSIGDSAFRDCSGLTSITIPSSVTSIGNWVFGNCSGLTSITIPSSVTSIGNYAFYNCSGLTSVTFANTTGWKAGSTSIPSTDLLDTSTAANYLRSKYYSSTWTRS